MKTSQIELAARNNALWCDTICHAHGVPGELLPTVWINRNTPPPYHSNLVVISDVGNNHTMRGYIRELIDLPLPGKWSVKDSYFNLELAPLGFEVLFEASWIWCDPILKDSGRSSSGIQWSRLTSPAELARWEAAWAGNARNPEARGQPAQFPAFLLEDQQIIFFAGSVGQDLIAGGIANRTGDVVGLSNIFVNSSDATAAWIGLVESVQKAFPTMPLVGYERDHDLALALACGFKPIGPLRVWIRQ